MGLRTLFKGLRPSDRKEPSTSPSPSLSTAGTDKNNSLTTVTSSYTLQPGACSSDTNVIIECSTPRDLWDEAYTILSREDPKLKQRYEEIMLTQEEGNGEPSQNNLGEFISILP